MVTLQQRTDEFLEKHPEYRDILNHNHGVVYGACYRARPGFFPAYNQMIKDGLMRVTRYDPATNSEQVQFSQIAARIVELNGFRIKPLCYYYS